MLFCITARFVALHVEAIQNHVQDEVISCSLKRSNTELELHLCTLRMLRCHHRLIYKAVHKINRYFGPFLALEVSFVFVGVISCSMFVVMGGESVDGILGFVNMVAFLDIVLHLFLLTSFSESISGNNQVLLFNVLKRILIFLLHFIHLE